MAPALEALQEKLRKYYSLTNASFVYPNATIFQPRGKLGLFNRSNFSAYGPDYTADAYSRRCRDRFIRDYQNNEIRSPSPPLPFKRPYSAIDNHDDEWEQVLQSIALEKTLNEYDHYISSPLVTYAIPVLDWWRQNDSGYPKLSLMVRDTLAVPATGAGVERQFSRSGRIVTPLRHRLNPETVHDIMMYKNDLARKRQEELGLWENAGAMVVEEERKIEEEEPPYLKEWKDQWWKDRKKCCRL